MNSSLLAESVMIFLSYARPDLEVVRKVYESLKQRDIKVWFDQVDLGPGKWKPQILRAITPQQGLRQGFLKLTR